MARLAAIQAAVGLATVLALFGSGPVARALPPEMVLCGRLPVRRKVLLAEAVRMILPSQTGVGLVGRGLLATAVSRLSLLLFRQQLSIRIDREISSSRFELSG